MSGLSVTKRCVAIAACSALLLGAAPVWAGALSASSGDMGAATVLSKHRNSAAHESQDEHRQRCWVNRDGFRNFGYFKC
jgi:hypothetical protein